MMTLMGDCRLNPAGRMMFERHGTGKATDEALQALYVAAMEETPRNTWAPSQETATDIGVAEDLSNRCLFEARLDCD
jgi:hypothetical protein